MGLGVGLVYDERMCAHRNEADSRHPETPARITSIYDRLKSAGVVERCVQVDARKATTEELRTVHAEYHVALMQEISSKAYGKMGRKALQNRYDSIYFNSGSSESALLAAGSVIEVATQVAEGKLASGACVVRPPGHHAEADAAMGFCLFNNVAIAAHILTHKKKELGVQKLLIVDWDVHHGNGTQHIFWDDPNVLYFSVHRYDNGRFYPSGNGGNFDKVGIDDGEGYNINVPWPHGGFGDADYLAVWEHLLMPVAHQFNPNMVLISAGFDSASGDPLGNCEVTPEGYFKMTLQLMELAKSRIVLALEGGYNLVSISNSYLACMQALIGDAAPMGPCGRDLQPETFPLLEKVRNKLEKYWPVLGTVMKALRPVPPTPAPSLAAEEIAKLILEEGDTSTMLNEKKKELEKSPEADQMPLKDLISLLSKLSTGEELSSNETHIGPTTTTSTSQQAPHTLASAVKGEVSAETSNEEVPHPELEMKEIGKDDIKVILRLPEEISSSQIGTLKTYTRRQRGGDTGHLNVHGGEAPATSDKDKTSFIWYACYGSSMWKPRFMCYVQGGQVEGMLRPCHGCIDKRPPVASDWLNIPNRLFFGHEGTSTWGLGGVAFLDPVSEAGVNTHARIYKITLEQFNDIFSQENWARLSNVWVNDKIIDKLRKGLPTTPHDVITLLEDDWYGAVKYLGEKDGLPILTFTCPESHMEKFRSGELATFDLADQYRTVIAHSLMEDLGMTKEQALDYLSSATLPRKSHNT